MTTRINPRSKFGIAQRPSLARPDDRNDFRDTIMGPDYVPTVFDEGARRQGEDMRAFMAETFPTDPALRDYLL